MRCCRFKVLSATPAAAETVAASTLRLAGATGRIIDYDSTKSKSGECFVKWDGDGGTGWYSMIATSTLGGMLDRDLPFHFL